MNENFKISELESVFNHKLTENGDRSHYSTGNKLADLLFQSEYYTKNTGAVTPDMIGSTPYEKVFAMFMRDPRFGMGRRDLGRRLMQLAGCPASAVVAAGRWDDLFHVFPIETAATEFRPAIEANDQLAKKWAPRYSSKNLMTARAFAKLWGMNKQQYGKFVKADTVERCLTEKNTDRINFEHVPSLALIKYWKRFLNGSDTGERFKVYVDSVKKGTAKINTSVTNVYDIYRNRNKIDPDAVYDNLEKISGSWLPIVDTSGSMWSDDAIGKALSIGKYLADTSTYCPRTFITFSQRPDLVKLEDAPYNQQINKMSRADWGGSTDFGAVMRLLSGLKRDLPEYLVVMSDMEFDQGSANDKDVLMRGWRQQGIKTKIVWWNFNARNKTAPETDAYGNIFMSGYNPTLLKYMEAGFNNDQFIENLLKNYITKVQANYLK